MKMDDMVQTFRDKGFNVVKKYHSDTGMYEFTIWIDGRLSKRR